MNKVFLIALGIVFVACSENSTNEDIQKHNTVQKKEVINENVVKEKVINKEPVKEATKPIEEVNVTQKVVVAAKTGQDVFKKCIACHGQSAEKKALGKSQIIKGWDSSKVANALNGYKDGTYGGAMKGVMKGQSSVLNDDDIKLVSEYISNL